MTQRIETLTEKESLRYARQISLPQFGTEGQLSLRNGSVLIVGAGGLGSPVALYLAAAGVGRIGVVDGDCVDLTNLQRQVIHTEQHVGMPKAESAAAAMRALNSDIEVEPIREFLTEENIDAVISRYDFIIDATDSFAVKFMLNDACVRAARPLCHGAIFQYWGQLMTIVPGSACYRCLFDSMPQEGGAPRGPIGVVAGVIGMLQANEALKYLSGTGSLLTNVLLRFDALTSTFDRISVKPSPDCPHRH